jgi:hypothetical protein
VKISEWDLGLSSCEDDDRKEILELVKDLKNRGVTRASVARSFCQRLIQPIKDQVHPAYEYWGQSDPMLKSTARSLRRRWQPGCPRFILGK